MEVRPEFSDHENMGPMIGNDRIASPPCSQCRHLQDELAALKKAHARSFVAVSETMSGPYEKYLAARNAESSLARIVKAANNRLTEHEWTHQIGISLHAAR